MTRLPDSTQLSTNFTLSEFRYPKVPETAPESVEREHLPRVVQLSQWMRDLVGVPLIVTSYWRSPEHNASIPNAATHSQHMMGDAVDLDPVKRPDTPSTQEIVSRVIAAMGRGSVPQWGELIVYKSDQHIHMSTPFPPGGQRNQQVLVQDGKEPGSDRDRYLIAETMEQLRRIFGGASAGSVDVGLLLAILVVGLAYFTNFNPWVIGGGALALFAGFMLEVNNG